MVKDEYGYTGKGGYLGMSRSARRNRNKTIERKLKEYYNNKPKKIRKKCYKCLIMFIIGIILILIGIISANINK